MTIKSNGLKLKARHSRCVVNHFQLQASSRINQGLRRGGDTHSLVWYAWKIENVDRTAILLSCLNNDCSALILILECLSVLMIEDLVLFKICPRELIYYLLNEQRSAVLMNQFLLRLREFGLIAILWGVATVDTVHTWSHTANVPSICEADSCKKDLSFPIHVFLFNPEACVCRENSVQSMICVCV